MTKEEAIEVRKHIHSVRNALNSIALNAELGKVLLNENEVDTNEAINKAFATILRQCRECDAILKETRNLALS